MTASKLRSKQERFGCIGLVVDQDLASSEVTTTAADSLAVLTLRITSAEWHRCSSLRRPSKLGAVAVISCTQSSVFKNAVVFFTEPLFPTVEVEQIS